MNTHIEAHVQSSMGDLVRAEQRLRLGGGGVLYEGSSHCPHKCVRLIWHGNRIMCEHDTVCHSACVFVCPAEKPDKELVANTKKLP